MTIIIIGISLFITFVSTLIGDNIAESPRIRAMFAIFASITFPKAIELFPIIAAFKLTSNSVLLVAKATMVNPITSGEIPILIANKELPRIKP